MSFEVDLIYVIDLFCCGAVEISGICIGVIVMIQPASSRLLAFPKPTLRHPVLSGSKKSESRRLTRVQLSKSWLVRDWIGLLFQVVYVHSERSRGTSRSV